MYYRKNDNSGRGDILILCCSFLYTGQILAIDHYNPFVDGVKMSCIQFLTGGMLGAICMFLFESPNMAMILNAAGPILYTGIMSTGVGYTLLILGQKGLNPTVAALIMSLESVFFALSEIFVPSSASYNKRIDRLCTYVYCDCISAASGYPKKSIKT